jgi:hypothetical protein
MNLKRVVAGGRLWNYHEHASALSPAEYANRVRLGKLHDKVLSSQLRAGFELRGILPEYLTDPRSRNYATLLVWEPPATSSKAEAAGES